MHITISTEEIMKNLRSLLLFAAVALLAFQASADIDKKLFEKAAKYVWGMNLPQFNPNVSLSDSIYRDQSAIYIARYVGMTADYDCEPDASKLRATGINNSNASKGVLVRRDMVKLNNAAAIEEFSEFTIDPPRKEDIQGFVLVSVKPAFGARIHKPDGSVVDVDMKEALTVTTGKKNKDAEYRIAIPGLEAGDILEYFRYTEMFFDELSLPELNVSLLTEYPTRNFMLDCRIAEKLAVEYSAYNGAPVIKKFDKVEGKNHLFIELENIDGLNESAPYFAVARQMPFYEICFLNNDARLEFIPKSARPGGIRQSNTGYLMSDVASALNSTKTDDKLIGSAEGIVKDWIKTHPDATPEQQAEAAWIALRYVLIKKGESLSSRMFAVTFYNLLERINNNTRHHIAITSSRKNVPVKELNHFTDVTYMVRVNDKSFIYSGIWSYLPGQVPPHYDGEDFIVFKAAPTLNNLQMSTEDGKIRSGRATDNTSTMTVKVGLNPDDENQLIAENHLVFKGNCKILAYRMLSLPDIIGDMEEYLGQKPMKMPKRYDAKAEADRITEATDRFVKQLWTGDDITLDSFEITEGGCTPDSPDFIADFKGKVNGAVTQAGNNVMVNLGRFISEQTQVEGSDRKRDVSIIRSGPSKYDNTILFEIPEGYELADGSLDDLQKSVVSADAAFVSEASVDGNVVKLRVVERYPKSISAPTAWPDILKVMDAVYEFNSASIVLRPKK